MPAPGIHRHPVADGRSDPFAVDVGGQRISALEAVR